MALTAFGFFPADSPVHRLDVRTKIACLVMISLASGRATFFGLIVLSLLVATALILSRAPVGSTVKQLKFFFLFLVFVFLARALSLDVGKGVWTNPFLFLSVSRQEAVDGALICWRLLLVATAGLLFTSTCSFAQIKAGAQWVLAPLPFIPERRVATMIGLILRFIPRVIHQAAETSQIHRARCIESRKNPLYRLKLFVISLSRAIFRDADRLAVAMAARGYQERRSDPQLAAAPADWIVGITVIVVCGLIFFESLFRRGL